MKKWQNAVLVGVTIATLFVCTKVAYGSSIPANVPTQTYIVSQHDTLWSIAEHFDPHANTQEVVTWIEQKNHLSDNDFLQVGQVLQIPVGGN